MCWKKAVLVGVLFVVLISGVAYMAPAVDVSADRAVFNSTTGTDVLYSFTGADYLNGSLNIFDQSGALARSFDAGTHANGDYSLHWSGDYGNGTPVPDGAYTINATLALDHNRMMAKAGNVNSGAAKEFWPLAMGVNASGYIFVSHFAVMESGHMVKVDHGDGSWTYVQDPNWKADTIYVFAPDGSFIRSFGAYGVNYSQISSPFSFAFNSSDFIFVADGYNVSIFYPDYRFYGQLDNSSVPGAWAPVSIAINSSGFAFVASNDSIHIFTPDYRYLGSFGSHGTGTGQYKQLLSIAIDPYGNIYAADLGNNRVEKFDSSGRFLKQWGSFGSGDGYFYNPYSLAVDDDSMVYVADEIPGDSGLWQCRTQVFDSEGNFVRAWNTTGRYYQPFFDVMRFIAVDRTTGHVLVSDLSVGGFGNGNDIYDMINFFNNFGSSPIVG